MCYIALNVVLGSLYQDELVIEPSAVVSLLAAASLLQLDAIILKCCEVMAQTVNIEVGLNNLFKFKYNWFFWQS